MSPNDDFDAANVFTCVPARDAVLARDITKTIQHEHLID